MTHSVKAFAYTSLGAEYLGIDDYNQADIYLHQAAKLFRENDYSDQFANSDQFGVELSKRRMYDSRFTILVLLIQFLQSWMSLAHLFDVAVHGRDMYTQSVITRFCKNIINLPLTAIKRWQQRLGDCYNGLGTVKAKPFSGT